MNERTIFLNALDEADPERRRAYLDFACAGNSALRKRIEALLRSHEVVDNFLEVPAMEQIVQDDQGLAFLDPSMEPGSLGRLDQYEILEIVGRGSMGMVLKGRDTKLQRIVAIKVLKPLLAGSCTARKLFVGEAQAAAAVRDDNVIAIYAVSDEGLVPYLVMEYIAGITLSGLIKQNGALGLREILRIGMQIARGLAAAHFQGLIHRDIKPCNILLENGVQRVKITDFGLAYAEKGVITGTPMFMSPEQARGDPFDHRSDLFSLGSILYILCTGQPPFAADNTVTVLKHVRDDSAQPIREINPDIPNWLCDLIGKLHAKEANDRFTSAQEVAELLGQHLEMLQRPFPTPGERGAQSDERAAPSAEPHLPALSARRFAPRLVVGACLAGLLLVVGTLVIYLVLNHPWRLDNPHDSNDPPVSNGPVVPLEFRRENIPPRLLALAGGGDPAKAPAELVSVLGDGRFLLPRPGSTAWMDQSPDGKMLAVPFDDDVVLFDVPAGMYLRSLKGPGGRVVWVTFSRDSRLLAASTWYEGWDGYLRVYDMRTGRVLCTSRLPGPKISGVAAFSPDGTRVVTEGQEQIRVLDARTGTDIETVPHRPGGCAWLSFSPDGRRLAASHWLGKQVRVFDWDGTHLKEVRTLDHHGPVGPVVYSPDGRFLASGDANGFKLWNAESLEEIGSVRTAALQLAFTPNNRTLFAATTNDRAEAVHTFTRWDVGTLNELPGLSVETLVDRGDFHHCLSRDGKVLFVVLGHDATYVRAIDAATGHELFPRRGHVARLNAVAVSPDGRTAASAGEDQVVKVWDLATGIIRHSLKAHTGAVCGLAFSPNGKQLASGSLDGAIVIWNMASGIHVHALRGHSRSFSQIQFSPDGKTLAGGGETGKVKFWEVASGHEASPMPGHSGAVRAVAFSSDGTLLASGGKDRNVLVHDLVKGGSQKLRAPNSVNAVAFSPDGHTLASVGDAPDAAVCLWDLDTGKETSWQGHTGHVRGLAFSPSAPLLATCGEDDTVRLWELSGGAAHARVIGPGPFGGGVRAVTFTPDGRYLATANANGTVYLLQVQPSR